MAESTICLLNDSFPPLIDGVANVVVNYAKIINETGGRAIVAAPSVPGADDSAFPFPVLRFPSVDTRKLIGYVAGFPFSPELAGRLRGEDTALLHCHCPTASLLLAREERGALDVPLVYTYHTKFDVDIARAVRGKLMQDGAIRAIAQNISACDEVWVVSRGAGENLRSLGYEGDYIVMENGVDMPRGRTSDGEIRGVVAGYDLPEGVPLFLFVGRLMWYKGLRIILDALAALKDNGVSFRMAFVGGGGDEAEVRAYAQELRLMDVCFFTGPVRDRDALRAWYCRADLFLFPSTFDTNGLVVREAAACSLASVLIRESCAAEGVEDGETGFLIAESAASLAVKLAALCRRPELFRAVGENASRELYVSWADAVKKARERYEIVIDRYRSGGGRRPWKPSDELFRMGGELMLALDRLDKPETVHPPLSSAIGCRHPSDGE